MDCSLIFLQILGRYFTTSSLEMQRIFRENNFLSELDKGTDYGSHSKD